MPHIPRLITVCSWSFVALFSPTMAHADSSLFDPFSGYRIAQYRAPIPDAPDGIPVVKTDDVKALVQNGAILLDVHPLQTYRFTEDGAWIYAEEHKSLPGATWLPVVGWGIIEGWAEAYLTQALSVLADPDDPIIVFCQLDCWLSWNAVQRVNELGYLAYWYPGGVDEWAFQNNPLVPTEPLAVAE